MNKIAKGLVLLNTALAVGTMVWAAALALQARDFGWTEPYREVVEWTKDGGEKTAVRYASEYEKSAAVLTEAIKHRDLTYAAVLPAMESMRANENYWPQNHFFFLAESKRLRVEPGEIKVQRFKNGGLELESPLGKPVFGDEVEGITKSYTAYEEDLKKIHADIDVVQKEIRKITSDTKQFARDLTGTDDMNKYVQPGLYQLVDLEFKAQQQIKFETEEIKPFWSNAVEQARLYRLRHDDLKATLKKLQPMPVK